MFLAQVIQTASDGRLLGDARNWARYLALVMNRALIVVGLLVAVGLFVGLALTPTPDLGELGGSEVANPDELGLAVATRAAVAEPERGAHSGDEPASSGVGGSDRGPQLDRKRADEMRELLQALYAGQLAAEAEQGEPGALPPGSMPAPEGTGNQADRALGAYVGRVMREQFVPLASDCYDQLLERSSEARGEAILAFSIMGEPSVGAVVVDADLDERSTLLEAEFRTCVRESMYAVVFDAPPVGNPTVTVRQTLEFSP